MFVVSGKTRELGEVGEGSVELQESEAPRSREESLKRVESQVNDGVLAVLLFCEDELVMWELNGWYGDKI